MGKPTLKSLQELGKLFSKTVKPVITNEVAPARNSVRLINAGQMADEHTRQFAGLTNWWDGRGDMQKRLLSAGFTPEQASQYMNAITDMAAPGTGIQFVPQGWEPTIVNGQTPKVIIPMSPQRRVMPQANDLIRKATFWSTDPTIQNTYNSDIIEDLGYDPNLMAKASGYNNDLILKRAERIPGAKSNLDTPETLAEIRRTALQEARSGQDADKNPYGFTPKAWNMLKRSLLGTTLMSTLLSNLPESKKSGGTIHIKKKNEGKFTDSAKRHGKSVQQYAHEVVNDPNATTLQKRRAQFAINAKKFNH